MVLKKFDSRFMSSERNLVISSSIFRISASNRSRMLLNSESITLKSPNLIGMSRLTPLLCAIYMRMRFSSVVCVFNDVCTREPDGCRKSYVYRRRFGNSERNRLSTRRFDWQMLLDGKRLWRKLETATRDVHRHTAAMLTYERTLSSRPARIRVYMSGKSNTHPRPCARAPFSRGCWLHAHARCVGDGDNNVVV